MRTWQDIFSFRGSDLTEELALAKAVKPSMKFVVVASIVVARDTSKKPGGSGTGRGPKHALSLFGSNSLASDDETVGLGRPLSAPRILPLSRIYRNLLRRKVSLSISFLCSVMLEAVMVILFLFL
jgi:hypothetical protein